MHTAVALAAEQAKGRKCQDSAASGMDTLGCVSTGGRAPQVRREPFFFFFFFSRASIPPSKCLSPAETPKKNGPAFLLVLSYCVRPFPPSLAWKVYGPHFFLLYISLLVRTTWGENSIFFHRLVLPTLTCHAFCAGSIVYHLLISGCSSSLSFKLIYPCSVSLPDCFQCY